MADTRGITVKVLTPLHIRATEEREKLGITMSKYMESILTEHFNYLDEKEAKNMGATRTIAFQVPEEFFMKVKNHLSKTRESQKDFFTNLAKAEIERFELSEKPKTTEDMDENSQNTAVSPQESQQEEGPGSYEDVGQDPTEGDEGEDEAPDENLTEDDQDEGQNKGEGFGMCFGQ